MSITTNYTFKNAANATVDIGTIFCDLINDQTIGGNKTFSNQINITGTNVINFGSDKTKQGDAGKMGYGTFSNGGSLDIIGAGTIGNTRYIKMWDNVTIEGYAYAASPPADSNNTSLATTAWVRSVLPSTGATTSYVDGEIAKILNGTYGHTICKVGVWTMYATGSTTGGSDAFFCIKNTGKSGSNGVRITYDGGWYITQSL
jgi:hypothetical protein